MQILLTGGAGFVGSRIAQSLSKSGHTLTIADDLLFTEQIKNLPTSGVVDWISREDLNSLAVDSLFFKSFDAIIHQGAISETTYPDFKGVYQNNFLLSKKLASAAFSRKIPFIYASSASVYGAVGKQTKSKGFPMNYYAYSKFLFDEWISNSKAAPRYLGLRYFNVYGPGEHHKGNMASMVLHAYDQIQSSGRVRLFGDSAGCKAGEHMRDFVFVDDIVDIVNWALDNDWPSKIVDVGTGTPETFNKLVEYTFESLRLDPQVEYIPIPARLSDQYQSFTQANPEELRQIGYLKPLTPLREGIEKYITEIKSNNG
jgi:ADP-L-glycero-D-manno-heptose 6-epimerase